MQGRSTFNHDQLAAEAAEWFVRINQRSVSSAVRQDFVEWMLRSAAHLEAYLAIAHVGGEIAVLENLPSREDLVAAAKADTDTENVIELRPIQRRDRQAVTCPRRVNRRGASGFAVAASIIIASFIVGGVVWQFSAHRTHLQTQIGEQRSVVLEEGSTVLINTNSDLSLSFSKGERLVALNRGEARFMVAKDPGRPFVVVTPQATVRAVGTVFNVYIGNEGTVVSVIEGKVKVTQRKEGAKNRLFNFGHSPDVTIKVADLSMGQQASVPTQGSIHNSPAEPFARALAWPRHQISFHDETLADLVAEFNRYHKQPMVIADAELATHEVDGTFDAFDHDSLLSYLERYQDVRVEREPNGSIVLRRKR
jgi:transmembrane sensor